MQANLGRVVGSVWYSGTDITGSATTGTIFEDSGITYARELDKYFNTDNGNVYECSVKGDASTAKWVYIANIEGPLPDMADNLTTDSTTQALTARQGKVLNEKLLSSGIYPTSINLDVDDTIYIAEMVIRNVDSTITFTSSDNETGTYSYTASGTAEQYTVSVNIGTDIGFSAEGAVLTNITNTQNIYSITLKDTNADTVYSETYNAWEQINKSLAQVTRGGTITDGTNTFRLGILSKEVAGTSETLFPTTHAKAVYFSYTDNKTLEDIDIFDLANVGNAGFHNSIYRGKDLGDTITEEQYAAIAAGTFDDMFVGDYWTINGTVYLIAGFDYWYNTGDTACTTHHVVIITLSNMYSAQMNPSNTTTGGYVGSTMYTTNLATAKNTITTDFGSEHILTHREYLTNAITSGYASAGAWYDSTVELMNEVMVYGTDFFTPHNSLGATIPNTHTINTTQLPLFRLRHDLIGIRADWWLRDVVSAAHFAYVHNNGNCTFDTASLSDGVRPVFAIRQS